MQSQALFRRISSVCFGLFFLCLPFVGGLEVSVTPTAENTVGIEPIKPLVIKLSVNEVRLDVVVLDKKTGNPITDLTAADFEVFQDNKRQEVLAAVYVDSQSDVIPRPASTRKGVPNLPRPSPAVLKEEDVGRTILFVIDDYGMSFENGYYAKMALRNFVEKQMQPGDLVSILRTDYGNRALNMFQSDKSEVLARINALPTTMAPKADDVGDGMWIHFIARVIENQKSTFLYSLRALNNMPGRKILNMVSPYMYLDGPKLVDEALRAGVVVNYLNIDGLNNFKSNYADASIWRSASGLNATMTQDNLIREMSQVRSEPIRGVSPLPAATGGIAINDNNFFLNGISKEVESLMRGYYLISYIPPQGTFEARGREKEEDYRSLKVRVNRKNAAVHTRNGFFGSLESELEAEIPEKDPLIRTIFSPFQSTDLTVNIAAGYVKDAEAGYLVRSWIHLDPEDVKTVDTEDGGARINLESLCVTSDINGEIRDIRRAEFSLSNIKSAEDIAWIRKHGIRFSMLLPVKKPGSYYVRVSVQDKESDRIGSAYQFLEIPNVKKNGLVLSNIFMITSADDLNWMSSDVKNDIAGGIFLPEFKGDVRSPALRTYTSGDNLASLALLYNADAKAIARSEIEMQTVLYRDGTEFRRGESMPITADGEQNPNGIPILQRMTIGSDMPPGDYVLQLVVTDKKNGKKKEGAATQALSFTVMEK